MKLRSLLSGKRVAVAAAAGALASVALAAPAFANSTSCSLGSSGGYCETVYINANYSGHYIDYKVCGNNVKSTSFAIRDYWNGVAVRTGSTAGCAVGRVTGLSSLYRLELRGTTSASGTISS